MPIQYKASSSTFGKRLRQARLAKGLPQDQLGVLAGLDEGTASARISRYESGTHEPPASFAEQLATALDVPAAYFYAKDDDLADAIQAISKLSEAQQKRLAGYLRRLQRE